jgi:hypothetical protein
MDYPNRVRLKLLGRVRVTDDPETLEQLSLPDYRARIDRGFLIDVAAFDWNCPQHITPRYTEDDVDALTAPLKAPRMTHGAACQMPGAGFAPFC